LKAIDEHPADIFARHLANVRERLKNAVVSFKDSGSRVIRRGAHVDVDVVVGKCDWVHELRMEGE
jgi:hypothetical protein